jgi:fibronectin-binding autotransporter adhesin
VVNFNQTGSYAFAPELTGSLAVNKLGAGTTILFGSNGYTGTTTISAGELIFANTSALGPSTNGAVTVAAGAGLAYEAAASAPLGMQSSLSITGGAGTVLGGSIGSSATGAEIAVTGAATATGAVRVNVYGISGVTPMAGTNTYTLLAGGAGSSLNGATYSLGTVYDNTNFTVGALTATPAALQVTATSATALTSAYWVGGLSGATNVWSASNGSTASNWTGASGGAVQGLIPGAGASVTISTTSPVTAPVATVLGADMSIGGLTIADTVNGLGLDADGFALTVGAGGITVNANVPASDIGANVVLGASQAWTNNSANTLTVSGAISGSAASALIKAGAGALILSGANTYTGATTVNAGTLTAGVASVGGVSGAFGNNSALILANVAGATLNLAGFNTQIGSLTGGGALGGNVTLGTATLSVGGDNTSPAAYAGVISGAGGALTKIGAGTLTLAGANTYLGLWRQRLEYLADLGQRLRGGSQGGGFGRQHHLQQPQYRRSHD